MDIDIICLTNDLLFNLHKMSRVFCNSVEIESRELVVECWGQGGWEVVVSQVQRFRHKNSGDRWPWYHTTLGIHAMPIY